MNTQMANPANAPKKKRGCFFYGCITVIVLGIATVVSIWLFFTQIVKPFFGRYATEQTVALQPSSVTPERVSDISAKVKAFGESIVAHRPTEPLVLDGADLNALLESVPDLAPFAKLVRVNPVGDRLAGEFAFPLDDFGFSGKFLNLNGTFKASLEDGRRVVAAESVAVNGEALPEAFMTELSSENLVQELAREPGVAQVLRELKLIEVKDGKVYVVPK